MAGPVGQLIRTYPVTFWLTVGAFSYAWKASLVASTYQVQYKQWSEERNKELANVKWNEETEERIHEWNCLSPIISINI